MAGKSKRGRKTSDRVKAKQQKREEEWQDGEWTAKMLPGDESRSIGSPADTEAQQFTSAGLMAYGQRWGIIDQFMEDNDLDLQLEEDLPPSATKKLKTEIPPTIRRFDEVRNDLNELSFEDMEEGKTPSLIQYEDATEISIPREAFPELAARIPIVQQHQLFHNLSFMQASTAVSASAILWEQYELARKECVEFAILCDQIMALDTGNMERVILKEALGGQPIYKVKKKITPKGRTTEVEQTFTRPDIRAAEMRLQARAPKTWRPQRETPRDNVGRGVLMVFNTPLPVGVGQTFDITGESTLEDEPADG